MKNLQPIVNHRDLDSSDIIPFWLARLCLKMTMLSGMVPLLHGDRLFKWPFYQL
jgi:hypothetical protein